jgi:transcriptional regulator with XRE-family HTH domain
MVSMQQIKDELKKKKITQKELSEKLDVSLTAIQKWFKGDSHPTIGRYKQILDLLDLENDNSNKVEIIRKVDCVIDSIYKKMSAVQKSNNHSKEELRNMINILYVDELLETITNEIISISKEPKD